MTKKTLIISLALIVPLLFFMGCAEDGKPVAPDSPLSIKLVAGPSGEVPFNAYVTYQWQAIGGSGEYTDYSYSLTRNGGAHESGSASSLNTITFKDLDVGEYVFTVTVTDSKSGTASSTPRSISVTSSTAMPVVAITQSPTEGSDVAENMPVTFAWAGDDPEAEFGVVTGYTYKLMRDTTVVESVDDQTYLKTVTIDSMTQGAYMFIVTAHNNAANNASDSISFNVIPANVLWIDDYDLGGESAEFVESQEKIIQLDGFAWNEFDIMENYSERGSTIPLLENILNDPQSTIEAVIWDQEETWGPFELYYATNGGTLLADYLDRGGNLVLIGNETNDQIIFNPDSNAFVGTIPPAEDDWEAIYQGIPTDLLVTITSDTTDTLITDPVTGLEVPAKIITFDTTYTDPYEYHGTSYSGGVPLTGMNGYPNISVDVGKVDPNEKSAYAYWKLSPEAKVITVDEDETVTCYIYQAAGAGKVVTVGIPLYYSPTQEYKDLIQKVLKEEFGL